MTEHRGPGIHRPGTGAHCFALVPFGIPIEEKPVRARERDRAGGRERKEEARDRGQRERDEMDEG